MLEYWFKGRRTLVDFRRGPLGPLFDGLAARLKERGYSHNSGCDILSKGCLFNSFLIDQGITRSKEIDRTHFEAFVNNYLSYFSTSASYNAKSALCGRLKHIMSYLVDEGILKPVKGKPIPALYRWVLNPYLLYLRNDCQFMERTIDEAHNVLCKFLDGLGEKAARKSMRVLRAEDIDAYVKQHLGDSPDNLRRLTSNLRGFLRFCVRQEYITRDLSGIIPSIPLYRLARLPKGMDDADLQRIINVIPKGTAVGTRDSAIMLLMIAYGVRGKSVAVLLLEDIDWPRSTIRIRACKGGKEVVLPLLEPVGEAILSYLHLRPESAFRELFLSVRAPHFPLGSAEIYSTVSKYMTKAGVKIPKSGSSTLRHAWAIRALAQDSPMKAIADVLGHRCLNTTFIYAKADLKMLHQVVMPWPEGR
jgi:site-specific recombinase XerD